MTSLRSKALSGAAWTLFGYGAAQVIRLGSNLILARLLFPSAFGVMALVTVVIQGLQMFSETGIGPGIIQHKRGEEPPFLNTAFTMQAMRGVVLWLACCVAAWPAAHFFSHSDPAAKELLVLLPVVGFTAVLGGINFTAVFTLNRQLDVARATLLELIPQVISVAAMVLWAWLAPSVWALVSGWLVYSVVRLFLSHWMNRPMVNRFQWEPDAVRELVRFGKWIFLGTLVAFLAGSLDRIVLGRLLSLEELGLYSIALTFARVGVETTNRLAHTVLFPALSRHQKDPARLVQLSLKARTLILIAGGGLLFAFVLLAPLFFGWLYDERYAATGRIAQWLAISVWFTILLSSMERVPLALGHSKALFVSNLVTTCGYGFAVPLFHTYGLPGFIIGLAAAQLIAHIVLVRWLPTGRGAMIRQSLFATTTVGIASFTALSLIDPLKMPIPAIAVASSVAICTALVLLSKIRQRPESAPRQ